MYFKSSYSEETCIGFNNEGISIKTYRNFCIINKHKTVLALTEIFLYVFIYHVYISGDKYDN